MPLQVGPCDPWPVDLCCQLPDDLDPAVVERWQRVASHILWRMSGMRWGPCPVTVRPCRRACLQEAPIRVSWGAAGPWVPYIGPDGAWRNASVCGCGSDCSCGELCEVVLPGPVYDIAEVNVDGQVLVPEAYRVDAPGRLVRVDGECWPSCQEMAAPPGAPGTFTVTYRWGLPLDEAAIAAVSELTCQLVLACLPPGTKGCDACRLPGNVTRVIRQGVQVDMADPTTIFSERRTGLTLVDLWLSVVNPDRLTSPSRIYSPDFRRPRVTTWP
ncbi:hypothetical protein ACFOWE_18255 [Planomonospora corallina]|uniref:Head-to-tail adaptor n=1 Tax=Planomonospora corallina TaxID=1806052 RepID=A0ABV8IAR2_9ACTN